MSKYNPHNFLFLGHRRIIAVFFLLMMLSIPGYSAQIQPGLELMERANSLYQGSKFSQAILLYRKAEERGADPVACAFNIANSYFQLGKIPEATAAYRRAVTVSKGQFAPALFNLAASLYRLGAYAECIATYHRALRADPENNSAWLYLAEAYLHTGDRIGMQRALENARRLDPDDISLIYQLSEVFVSMEEIDRAAALVREGYARNPKETDFLIYLGDIFRASNRLNDAINAWREALSQQTENTELLYKLADAVAEQNNPYLAMDYLAKALVVNPKFSDASIFLGNLAFELKWWDRAESAYVKAGNNGNVEAVQGLRNLAYEAEQRSQISESIRYLKLALVISPKDLGLKSELESYESQL